MAKLGISLLTCLSLTGGAAAQRALLEADTTVLDMGGQTWVHLTAQRDPAVSSGAFTWPTYKDTLPGGWEVLETLPLDTSLVPSPDGRDLLAVTQSMRVTAWDTGVVRMPELPLVLGADTVRSNALLFVVKGPQLGEEGQIANFADVVDVEWTWWERFQRALPYLLGALLLAGLATGAYFAYRRWQGRQALDAPAAPEAPREPADVIALRTLRRIQEQAAWKQGLVKGHHSEVSTAVRAYLEHRFGFAALELTTAEIRRGAHSIGIDADQQRALLAILELTDLVKFAKYTGGAEEHERVVRQAITFVEQTRPRVETPAS